MRNRFATRMAAVYAAFFFFGGLQMPFFPAWLEARGLDSRDIGFVLAGGMAARLLVLPFATRLADRFGVIKGSVVIATVMAAAAYGVAGFVSGVMPIAVVYAVAAMAAAPIIPLSDAYALRGLAAGRLSYGSVRLWGSVAFIAANLGGGVLLAELGRADIVWALAAAMALTAVTAVALPALPAAAAPAGAMLGDVLATQSGALAVWRAPGFAATVAAASLIQSSHATLYGFSTVQWTAQGLDGYAVGVLWATGVAAEVALFAYSARVVSWLGPLGMVVLGGGGAVVRWSVMALDPPSAWLVPLQLLHALSFGATHLGAMHVIAQITPRRGAAAQGDYALAQGATFAGATVLAGLLFESAASLAYGAMACAAALGVVIAVCAQRLRRGPSPA